jgi:hypothetical protein
MARVLRQQLGIAIALAHGGQLDGEDTKPVIEVGAEPSGTNQLFQWPVRGRDETDVDRTIAYSAHPADRFVLEQLEKLDLDGRLDVADLVEEQRAAMGRLDQPDFSLLCVGEGAALMTEQFRFEELHRQRTAIDFDERLGSAWALEVKGAGDQFLACPRLALNEHGRGLALDQVAFGLHDGADALAQPVHRRRDADQLALLLLLTLVVVGQRAFQPLLTDRLVDEKLELAEDDRFGNIVVRAGLHGIDRRLHPAVAGDADHLYARVAPADFLQHLEAVQIGQIQVE